MGDRCRSQTALPSTSSAKQLQDQYYFQPELASGGNNNVCERLEDLLEGHSSNPVAKQLISMCCVLGESFLYTYTKLYFQLFHLATPSHGAELLIQDAQESLMPIRSSPAAPQVLTSFSAKHGSIMSNYKEFPLPHPKQCSDINASKFCCDTKHLSYDLLLFSSNYNLRPI